MANTILIKRSSVSGSIPNTTTLQTGELALNTYDGILFTNINNGTDSIVMLGGNYSYLGDLTVTYTGLGTKTVTLNNITTAGTYNQVIVNSKGLVTSGTYTSSLGTISLTGDATGSGSSTIAVTLAASGVTAGTYNTVTVNAKGLVTSATNVSGTSTGTWYFSGDVSGSGSGNVTLSINNTVSAGTYTQLTINSRGLVTYGANPTIYYSGDVTGSAVLGTNVVFTLPSSYSAGNFTSVTVNAKGLVTGGSTPTINYGGDVTGTAVMGASVNLTLGNSGIGAGTYTSVTVNPKGIVTAGSNPTSGGPTLTFSGDVSGTGSGNITLLLTNSITSGTYTQLQVNSKGLVTYGQNPTIYYGGDVNAVATLGTNVTFTLSTVLSAAGTFSNVVVNNKGLVTYGSNPATQLYGALTGSAIFGSPSLSLTLANTGVTAGTFNTVTVNAQGLITSAKNTSLVVQQMPAYGAIAAMSSNTTLTLSGTAPTSTQGTQIWSGNITPSSSSSVIYVGGSFMWDANTANAILTCAVFRQTTCIGSTSSIHSAGTTNNPSIITWDFMDKPNSTLTQTYSMRIGVNGTGSTTWYVGQTYGYTNGNTLSNNCYILTEYI